jgi:hypothetical protein
MGRVSKSENLRRGGRSPCVGTGEAGCNAVLSVGSELFDWETSEVCTTPCTTTNVPAAGKFRLASGGGAWAGSGGVAGRSITSNGSGLSCGMSGVLSG